MTSELRNATVARVITEAAFNPAKWTDVCDGMASLVSGDGAVMIPADIAKRSFPSSKNRKSIGLPRSDGIAHLISVYEAEGWHKNDLRIKGLPAILRRGYTIDSDCIEYDEIQRSPFYQEFLKPAGLLWFVGIGIQVEQSVWCLSVLRHLQTEQFSEHEIQEVLSYRDLLSHSAGIARQLGNVRVRAAADILEQHGLCAIAIDATGKVISVSPSAERHFTDTLQIIGGKLHAKNPTGAAPLTRLIDSVCGKALLAANPQVVLARTNGKPPLVLYACKLPEAERDIFQPAIALIVISDPEQPQEPSCDLLMDYFGFTRAEGCLAVALMGGTSIEDYAIGHSISPVTVRNHLQGLLRKTATHRQAELISTLNRVVPGL
jgi:DNA-binding CsgD family transcriptional regulator